MIINTSIPPTYNLLMINTIKAESWLAQYGGYSSIG